MTVNSRDQAPRGASLASMATSSPIEVRTTTSGVPMLASPKTFVVAICSLYLTY